ncbi:MAG TPA: energy transducer TonB [Burkholderiaceae bacterium]|nr:energy transducer TonB [Burkholderiaceae bacterium]
MTHVLLGLIGSGLVAGAIAAALAQDLGGTAVSVAPAPAVKASEAADAKGYRQDGARHLYAVYADRIYRGKLPPLIHAVVVIETELDAQGRVMNLQLIRVPSHAPEVVQAVRDMIQRASPWPAPARMGGVKYTEVWLVDKSGRFQLDALTEGQRGE